MKRYPIFGQNKPNTFVILASVMIVLSQSIHCMAQSMTPIAANQLFTSALDTFVTKSQLPGVAAAFVYNGQLQPLYLKGNAALPNTSVTQDTIFAIGSVTKTFTGILTAIAINSNVLTLDDTVAKWFPALASAAIGKATIEDLATHTSGLPNYPPGHTAGEYTTDQFIEFLKTWNAKGLIQIGQNYSYSDSGYWLLRMIVDKAFNDTYENLLNKNIFTPLDMTSSNITPPASLLNSLALGYTVTNAPANLIQPITPADAEIAGDVQSSINDMGKFLLANLAIGSVPQALSAAINLSHQAQVPISANSMATVGWFNTPIGSVHRIDKDGQTTGFTSYIGIVPEKQMGIVILVNKQNVDPTSAGRALIGQLLQST